MPGGRVTPVYYSESLGIQQAKAAAAAAHAEAEAARQKAAEAQDLLRREALRLAQLQAEQEQALLEQKQKDEDRLYAQLQSKLVESNPPGNEQSQFEADSNLHDSQMTALLAEKAERDANPVTITSPAELSLDTDAIAAEMAALQVRIQNVLDTDIAGVTAI